MNAWFLLMVLPLWLVGAYALACFLWELAEWMDEPAAYRPRDDEAAS